MPNLGAMGLGNITDVLGVPPTEAPSASWGRCAEASAGKDTTTGHWEMMGLELDARISDIPGWLSGRGDGRVHARDRARVARQLSGERNRHHPGAWATSTCATGKPIIYTSADSVFQIAAHEDVIPIERLYEIC